MTCEDYKSALAFRQLGLLRLSQSTSPPVLAGAYNFSIQESWISNHEGESRRGFYELRFLSPCFFLRLLKAQIRNACEFRTRYGLTTIYVGRYLPAYLLQTPTSMTTTTTMVLNRTQAGT